MSVMKLRNFLVTLLIVAVILSASVLVLSDVSISKTKLKVALVVSGELGDKSFFDSSKAGLDRAVKELGVYAKVLECKYDPANYVPYLVTAAQNFDMVFVVGFELYDALKQVAPQFSNVDFVRLDEEGKIAHVTFIDFLENEGSFLAGALAAMMTVRKNDPRVNPQKIIGAVCGEDIPVIHNFLVGYEQGAKYIDPETKVLVGFVGSWSDPAKGKEMAVNQHKNGADVIFQIAGATGEGVITAAKEGGFYAIGVDSPQEWLAPDAVIASMVKRCDNAVYDMIKAKLNGTYKRGYVYKYGLKNNGVGLDWEYMKLVPEDIKKKLKKIEKDIIDGKIKVKEYKP